MSDHQQKAEVAAHISGRLVHVLDTWDARETADERAYGAERRPR